jgi:hypothetical protein
VRPAVPAVAACAARASASAALCSSRYTRDRP